MVTTTVWWRSQNGKTYSSSVVFSSSLFPFPLLPKDQKVPKLGRQQLSNCMLLFLPMSLYLRNENFDYYSGEPRRPISSFILKMALFFVLWAPSLSTQFFIGCDYISFSFPKFHLIFFILSVFKVLGVWSNSFLINVLRSTSLPPKFGYVLFVTSLSI